MPGPLDTAVVVEAPRTRPAGVLRVVSWTVLGLTFVTVAIGLWGLRRDLPFPEVDEPTFVRAAVHIAATGDPDPHWFGHPGSTVIYPLAVIFHASDSLAHGGPLLGSDAAIARRFRHSPGEFYLLGRLLVLAYSTASVPLLFAVGRRVFGTRAALLGTWFWVLLPLSAWYGDIVRTDLAAAFFGLCGLWACLRVLDEPTRRNLVVGGAAAGFAIATRYFMVALIPVLCAARFIAARRAGKAPAVELARDGGISVLAALGAFALVTPYFFVDFHTAQRTLADQSKPHLGNDGFSQLGNLAWYLRTALPHALTVPIALLTVAGIALAVGRLTAPRALLLLFATIFMAGICVTPLHWSRWTLQVIPVLLLFAASAVVYAFDAVTTRVRIKTQLAVGGGLIATVALSMSPAVALIDQQQLLARPSTRTLARDWIIAHVPSGTRVGTEIKTAPLDHTDLRVTRPYALALRSTVDSYEDRGFRYLIVNGHVRGVYLQESRRYPIQAAFYRNLAREGRLRLIFRPSSSRAGSTILIYELPKG